MAQVAVTTKLPATAVPGGSFTMEVDVAKGDVSGFAMLQQILPPGFTAEAGESANATFSFKDQKVKFLWMALPNGDFKVTYKINIDASLSGNRIIEGTFAYIQDNETEKFIIPKDIISIQASQADAAKQAAMDQILADQKAKDDAASAAREDAAPAEEVVEEVAEVIEEATEVIEEEVAEVIEEVEEVIEEVEEVVEKAAARNYNDAMMKSKPGLVFRVQISAGTNKVDPEAYKQKYGISEVIVIEEHEGMYKYVVGEFGSYRPAKTFSNELRDSNNVVGPFVTAYNDGIRIHVKEALEIAGQ